ncbi:MAG: NrdJb [Porticoccus sp.]|nr:NrdJb [Porticoccus sp.]
MMIKLDQKIVSYKVLTPSNDESLPEESNAELDLERAIELMTENVSRPEELHGSTYKVKTPQSEHALYITINDIILNPETDNEQRRPFEIFINSKNMEQFQWVVALTRVVSAVFRKGGDCTFLAEELKAVFDPQGGYFKRGGKFMPSLVAEIGEAIENHLTKIGMIKVGEITESQKTALAEKRAEYDSRITPLSDNTETENTFPASASLCKKCMTKAVILMDGCMTCLNCGDSKCS